MSNYLLGFAAPKRAVSTSFSFSNFVLLWMVSGLLLVSSEGWGQITYTWNQSGDGSWATSTNWTPMRTTPATNDIMVINNGGSKIISDVPTQAIGKLQISNSTTVTLRPATGGSGILTISTASSDALIVAAGSVVTITGRDATMDRTLTVTMANTSGLQAHIDGTLRVGLDNAMTGANGVFTKGGANATIFFNSGATYVHALNGGNIPLATWNATSACNIIGVTNTIPGNNAQNFGHFIWNCPSQNANENLANTINIQGDLTIISTGAGSNTLRLVNDNIGTIGGSYNQSGGNVIIRNSMAHGLIISENFNLSGGNFENQGDGTPGGTIDVEGDYFHTSGTLSVASGGLLTITFNGTGIQVFRSGGTVTGTVDYVVNGGSILQMFDASTVVLGNSFALLSGATFGITSPEGITVSACGTGATCGNIRTTSRTFNTAANYLYNGAASQNTGNGLPATLTGDLEIDNPDSVLLSAAQTINTPGMLALTNGKLITDATNLLTLGNDVTVVPGEGSSGSFVDGPVQKLGDDAFIFPIGNGTTWAPLGISDPGTNVADGFTAQYNAASSPDAESLMGALERVSTIEHWDLDRINPMALNINPVNITLFWTSTASAITDLSMGSGLTIAHYTGSMWEDITATVDGGSTAMSGSITSAPVNSFSPFSFGSTNPDPMVNPLPIELISFTATPKDKTVQLDWRTATELNNAFFDIERSANGRDFESLGKIAGAGTSLVAIDYQFTDALPLTGWNYYRLRQEDFDGQFSYSPIQAVLMGKAGEVRLQVFPNPANNELNLQTDRLLQAGDRIEIYDYTGRQVLNVSASDAMNGPVAVSQLPAGNYIVRLRAAEHTVSASFVKQ